MNDLMSALGALSIPREQLFKALGSRDGSGSALLAQLGVDPESSLGQYGGIAAEMVGDPLNLLSLGGAAAAGAGIKGLQTARRAGQIGEVGADLTAGTRLAEAAGGRTAMAAQDALNPGAINFLQGPGGMPVQNAVMQRELQMPASMMGNSQVVSPAGMFEVAPEQLRVAQQHAMPPDFKNVVGSGSTAGERGMNARAERMGMLDQLPRDGAGNLKYDGLPDYVTGFGGPDAMSNPQTLSGFGAKQYQQGQLEAFKGLNGPGTPNRNAMAAFRADDLAGNAAANASNSDALLQQLGTPMDGLYKALGPNADSVLARVQGNPQLMSALTGGNTATELPALLAALQAKMGGLQAAPISSLPSQLATMGIGGAAGGRMGTQAINGYRGM